MIEPRFPEVWSDSSRSAFAACPRRFFYSHVLSLRKSTEKNIHLHFGHCFAKGLEITRKSYWDSGMRELDAIAAGVKALIIAWGDYEMPPGIENTRAGVKDLAGCIDALVSYFEYHQLGNDIVRPLVLYETPMIETTFCLPVPGTRHPITGNPILYAGRFDMLVGYQDAVFVLDEKSTLQLGASWRSGWPMRGQFSGYAWGAASLLPDGHQVSGAIVRGIGIMKQSINFETAIMPRPQWQIDQWLRQLRLDIERAATHYTIMCEMYEKEQHLAWDQNLDSACSSYSGCGYINLCDTPDPRTWYGDYASVPWNPLQREEDAS